MRALRIHGKWVLAGTAAFGLLASAATAHAEVTVLYAFKGGRDGAYPHSRLIRDTAGNLYGTTGDAGTKGTVFKLEPGGRKKILHVFTGRDGDGAGPYGGLIEDGEGSLYGTTQGGGAYREGTVFKLAPDGTETVFYSFCSRGNCVDGANPSAGLLRDKKGNLYGTTGYGGGTGCENGFGCGTVFKLAPDGTETVLHTFVGGSDGSLPRERLIQDEKGNLYSTTSLGGGGNCKFGYFERGCGTVFEIAPDGTETVLHAFRGHKDGSYPSGVLRDKTGNLYGATGDGGGYRCRPSHGCGTVFKLAPDGTETVLHAFAGGKDGAFPNDLIRDKEGNLYGTTGEGGGGDCHPQHGCGTVFEIAPDGTETVLFAFKNHKQDGSEPWGGLLKGGDGELYGTAPQGGSLDDCNGFGCGTVFRLER
jgi:uncharacterized repeat protein (TIGR03803 family)